MDSKTHLGATLVVTTTGAIIERHFSGTGLTAAMLGGVVIDLDHLVYSIIKLRSAHPRRLINLHKKMLAAHEPHFYPLHTIEAATAMTLLLPYNRGAVYFLASYYLHLILDAWAYTKLKRGNYWFLKWWACHELWEVTANVLSHPVPKPGKIDGAQ